MSETNADKEIIQKRHDQLTTICGDVKYGKNFPLIKEVAIDPVKFKMLQDAVGNYLYASLLNAGHKPVFSDFEEMAQKYKKELLSLPNVTPNGLLRPKRETFLEFNLIHRRIVDILKQLGVDEKIVKMRLPLTLRMVDGTAPDWIKGRPKANNKMHSDFWTGGCCDFAILCPLLGDVGSTTVKFAEPKGIKDGFLSELTDYDEGKNYYSDSELYDMTMQKGFLYFQDIYCLHGTWREGGGLRVSMDWTVQSTFYPEIEKLHSSKALETDNHWDLETWYSLGEEFVYIDTQTVGQCKTKLSELTKEVVVKAGSTVAGQTSDTAKIISVMESPSALKLAKLESKH